MPFHFFGIRHHGPGSARSLVNALTALAPDCLLVEGPPEAEEVLSWAAREELRPPVALLLYDAEKPQRAVYYPLAVFSPEWQAIRFGLSRQVPIRFMDLPQSVQMARMAELEAAPATETSPEAKDKRVGSPGAEDSLKADLSAEELVPPPREQEVAVQVAFSDFDPLDQLARAAGYSDTERWWEHQVEHRREDQDVFAAILEAMTALREAAPSSRVQRRDPEREELREAYMRQTMRAAEKEGFQRIAVVSGAWHGPALATRPPVKEDHARLKGLPKRKVNATWIPWTYGRLAAASGYGAGIESPGWYDFLWQFHETAAARWSPDSGVSLPEATRLSVTWLTRVARLLRGEDLEASSASVIEAVRLAEALAAVRQRPWPGLPELNEATQAVLCFGAARPLQLIGRQLIVSERLGGVPDDVPRVPLAGDLAREQKRLRLPAEASARSLDLDLRRTNDLDRSRLLHRLNVLGISWGRREQGSGSQKGTFHERWSLQWQPEFSVALIERGVWGNTLPTAATAFVRHESDAATGLPALTSLVDSTLLADLPEAAEHLVARLQSVAAVTSDVGHLLEALPPLAQLLRYGNVRKIDAEMVSGVVNGLVARVCVGLPMGCGSLNEDAAEAMFERILPVQGAIALLANPSWTRSWNEVLQQLADQPNLHGLIAGRACRLLLDVQQWSAAEAARRLGLALSVANAPAQASAWVDGFLRHSGLLLLHDEALWRVLQDWVGSLTPDHFMAVLPLLRRTFSTFAAAERRHLGQRAAWGSSPHPVPGLTEEEFDRERADLALPLLAQLLGLNPEPKT